MAVSAKTRWVLILLLLAAAGGAGVPLLEKSREREIVQFIEAIPGTLKADKVSVSLLNNRVELTGLKGRIEAFAGHPLDVDIEALTLEGLERNPGDTAGEVRLAERVLTKNLRLSTEEGSRILKGYRSLQSTSSSMEGLWVDWNALRRAAAKRELGEDFVRGMLSLRFGASESVGDVVAHGGVTGSDAEALEGSPFENLSMTMRTGRCQSEPYSLTAAGKSFCTDMEIVLGEGPTIHMKTLGLDAFEIPEAAIRADYLGVADLDTDPAAVLNLFSAGFSISNLTASETVIDVPGGGSVEIPAASLSMALGGGKLHLDVQTNDVMVATDVLRLWFPEWGTALDGLGGEPLHLRCNLSLDTPKGEAGMTGLVLDWQHGERRLWDSVLSMTLTGRTLDAPGALMPIDASTLALVEAEFEIRDKDLLHFVFQLPIWPSHRESGDVEEAEAMASRRRSLVEDIEDTAAMFTGGPRDFFDAYARWISESGTLRVRVKPDTPFPLMQAFLLATPDSFGRLNISATHTPPEKQE